MSVVSYVLKTSVRDIRSDVNQYNQLRARVKFMRKETVKALRNLSRVDNEACIGTRSSCASDAGFRPRSLIRITNGVCYYFDPHSVCKMTVCKYHDLNADYFKALHEYRAVEKQRKIYWTQKFANCK